MTGIEDGWVCDVELAKNIILAHFSTSRYYFSPVYGDKSMDDWLDKVENNLQDFDGDFSIMREGGWLVWLYHLYIRHMAERNGWM